MTSEVLINESLEYEKNARFYLEIRKVTRVSKSKKYPKGYKLSLVLIDLSLVKGEQDRSKATVILLDYHAPDGFHYHNKLPHEHDSRIKLEIQSIEEALEPFNKMKNDYFSSHEEN